VAARGRMVGIVLKYADRILCQPREKIKQGSSSFLKKRTKKLLSIGVRNSTRVGPRALMSKSFLVLFFKKELLPLLFLSHD
jgi:hypothetical protein